MSETVMFAEPKVETPAGPATPAPRRERSIRPRRQRRLLAGLRFNALRYLTLLTTLPLAWGLVRLATREGVGPQEASFLYVLAGGMLAAAAKTAIDLLSWAEVNRQAIHVERVRAVQRVFQKACALRDQAVIDWRRIHTVLIDNLSGQPQEVRFFHDHDEADRQAEALFQRARSEEFWIRAEGVDAVRRFKARVVALDYKALAMEAEFLAAFDAQMNELRRDLALAAVGTPLDDGHPVS